MRRLIAWTAIGIIALILVVALFKMGDPCEKEVAVGRPRAVKVVAVAPPEIAAEAGQ